MFNARSIVNKISELHHLLYVGTYDLYFVAETWLHDRVCSGLLDPNSEFSVLRKDRTDGRGGGVCVFVRKHLRIMPVTFDDEFRDIEMLCFDLISTDNRVRFFMLYRPPSLDNDAANYMRLLIKCLSRYESVKHTNVLLGDLNLPKVNWHTNVGLNHDVYTLFLSHVIESSYCQLVSFPTRDSSTLDVILTSDTSLFSAIEPDMPVSTSDHLSVKFMITLPCGHKSVPWSPSSHIKYNWFRGDYEAMESFLHNVDWYSVVYSNPSALASWNAFLSVLYDAVDLFVPRFRVTHTQSKRHRHTSRTLAKLTAKKRHLWRQVRARPFDSLALMKYRDCVHEWRRLVQRQEISVEENIVSADNVNTFYKFVNNRLSNRSSVLSVTDMDGSELINDLDIANAFNDYFASVVVNSNNLTPAIPSYHIVSPLASISFSEGDVLAAINKLKSNLSAGPDGLPPLLFKRVKHAITVPLTLVFRQLLSVGCVPDEWKNAVITPVHKKGSTSSLTNYRPISITCVPCKLLERIVVSRIYNHLVFNDVLHCEQHGFVRGLSTCTNLLTSLNDWTRNTQDGCQTIVIYIDFTKAFDVVQHDKLFSKLRACGIDGTLLQWIINLFSNRTFCTRINELLSSVVNMISGVIQGSVIGPLMFLIYINDLIALLARYNIKVKLFADDVKLYVKVVNAVDAAVLHEALAALVSWADEWQLSVSVNKCGVLCIGKDHIVEQFSINNTTLPIVTSYPDLGITITSDLSPSSHIDRIVLKAHQRANIIHRCFVSRNVDLLVRAFITYVRPLLEYNSVTWSPHLKYDIERIEKVQRRFTKRLHGFSVLSYNDRLKQLNMYSLEHRRLYFDLLWCYKLLFGLVRVNRDDFFTLRSCSTRGHPYKIF